jgi:putative ABC transport system permease protein
VLGLGSGIPAAYGVTPSSSLLNLSAPSATLVLDSTLPPDVLQPAVRTALRGAEADMALPMLARWSDAVSARIAPHERRALFASLLAVTSTLLVGASLYALIARTLEARGKELAVRIALGCPPGRARMALLTRAATIALSGAVPGALAALPLVGTAAATLGTSAGPVALVSAGGALVLVATVGVLAAWKPARDSGRVDPSDLLRA